MYRLVYWEDKAKWIICQPPLYTSPCKKQNITTTRTITDFALIKFTMIIITMPLYLRKNHTYIYLGWESCLGLFPGMIRQLRSRLSLSVWLSTWEATAVLPYMAGRGCISCPTLFSPLQIILPSELQRERQLKEARPCRTVMLNTAWKKLEGAFPLIRLYTTVD